MVVPLAFAAAAAPPAARAGAADPGSEGPGHPVVGVAAPDPVAARIINGVAATEDDWPMSGGLVVGGTATVEGYGTFDGRGLMCSSALIAPDVVLTAAHCVDVAGLLDAATQQGAEIQSYEDLEMAFSRRASLTEWDLGDSIQNGVRDWPEDSVFATRFFPHPDFDLLTLQTGIAPNHDIGLVFLEAAIEDVPFALLPTADEGAELAVGTPVEIVGWGQQQQDAVPGTYGVKRMGASTISEIGGPEFQVGADYDDVRKCHGDSGGPSFAEVTTDSAETTRLVGVTSHAYDTTDCRVTGGVDTRVDAHLDWIDAELRAACADGTRVWCLEEGIIAPPDAAGLYAWERDGGGPTTAGDDEEKKGCGCASGGPGAGLGALALGALAVRRRSRCPRAVR